MNPKSILKRPLPSQPSNDPLHDRNYATALHHAQQIQLQKEASSLILDSTETLLDTPTSPTSSASHPSPSDTHLLTSLLRPFQPADFDALIHERNIISRCGYPLCPDPPTLQPTSAKYRLLFGKGKGADALKVVKREELEKWCSEECGRRALFLRVQLEEEPAWLREGEGGPEIRLLEEDEGGLVEGMRGLGVGEKEEDVVKRMKALAIERGDGGKVGKLGNVIVKENVDAGMRMPAPPKGVENDPGAIEGYKPKHKGLRGMKGQDSDEDEATDIMDTI